MCQFDIGKAQQIAYDEGYEQGKRDAVKWIPCKERLPEKPKGYGNYIVMIADAVAPTSLYWDGDKWFDGFCFEYDVIAWMPFPKPYAK